MLFTLWNNFSTFTFSISKSSTWTNVAYLHRWGGGVSLPFPRCFNKRNWSMIQRWNDVASFMLFQYWKSFNIAISTCADWGFKRYRLDQDTVVLPDFHANDPAPFFIKCKLGWLFASKSFMAPCGERKHGVYFMSSPVDVQTFPLYDPA